MNRAMRRHGIEPRDPHVRFERWYERALEDIELHRSSFSARTLYNRAVDDALRLASRDPNYLRFELNKALHELIGALS